MKLTCTEPGCGTTFDAAERETVEKLRADHQARFHENKETQIRQLASSAKSMAFAVVNGATPKRKDARALVSLASQILNEPIPDMPDETDKSPASNDTDSGGTTGKPVALQAGATSDESREEAAKAGAELNKKNTKK